MSLPPLPAKRSHRALLAVGGFALLQLLLFALLVVGAAVPDKPIVSHLAQDVRSGTYGPTGLKDRMGGSSDTFTECVVVGTGLGSDISNPLTKAGKMPRISNCAEGKKQILQLESGVAIGPDSYYFRYWAGYTSFTRPILAVWGMTGVRLVTGAMLLGSILLAVGALSSTVGRWGAAALIGPLVVSTNLMSTPSTSFSQAVSISAYLAGVAIVAWAGRRSVGAGLVGVVVASALFCFVDLLTTPSIGWALCAVTLTAVTYLRTHDLRPTLIAVMGSGLLWPVAFALTWISRWILAIPFVGPSGVLDDVKESVFFRSRGEYTGVKEEFGAATLKNGRYWLDHMATSHVVLVIALVIAIVGLLASLRGGPRGFFAVCLIGLPAAVVPFWYEALSNHSQIHTFFVYRAVPVSLGVAMLAGVIGVRIARGTDELAKPVAIPQPAKSRELVVEADATTGEPRTAAAATSARRAENSGTRDSVTRDSGASD